MAIDINIPSQVKNYANLAGFPATGSVKTIFIAEDTNKTYRWTGSAYVEISASQAASWGTITGPLSSQTDLNTALSGKQATISLTTTGTGAATFVSNVLNVPTPAAATFSSLTTTGSSGASTLTSGVLNVPAYSLSGLGGVPTTRTLTINGTTQDLSADRTFTISTGITIGTTAITSGTVGRVLFEGTGNVVQESANLFWDNTNGRLGIGSSSPLGIVHLFASSNTVLLNFARASNNAIKAGWFQVDASDNVVYTSTNGALDFKTNWNGGTQLSTMYLNSNGTVGIGTSTLTTGTPLTIQGALNNGLTIRGNSTNDRYKQFIGNGTTYTVDEIFLQSINTNLNILGGATGTTNWLTIKGTGNVLINTTTDAGYKLDVNGTARVVNNLISGNGTYFTTGSQSIASASTAGAFMEISSGASNSASLVFSKAGSLSTLWQFYCDSSNNLAFFRNGVNKETFKLFESTKNVGIDEVSASSTFTDVASAKLFVNSTTKGFLPPRMTTTQKNAIASPATGLMVYDTTLNLMALYNGTTWTTL